MTPPVWAPPDYPGDLFDSSEDDTAPTTAGTGSRADTGQDEPGPLTNYYLEEAAHGRAAKPVRRGHHPRDIQAALYRMSGGWPRRVGDALFAVAPGPTPRWLDGTDALFAAVAGELGAGGGPNPVDWARGQGLVSKAEFFEYLRQQATAYEAIEPAPHEPQLTGHFYLHPELAGGDGKALAGLLARFRPATREDAELVKAFLLTLVWGGPGGARPAFLITGPDNDPKAGRGVGKTTLGKVGAALVGGAVSVEASDGIGDVKARLLSPDALGRRVVLLDNIKSHKFGWGELEGLITADTVSGHRMYAGEGRRPNALTYVLTLNGASLSKDTAQRCVVVKLARPRYSPAWEEETLAYVREHL
jgi:hypothetical protein